ncbi:MAG: SLC13 family permease, partial [Gammaproteobacteria bacterium]|nr:SLC13 family permease [Gammaproteobacteria bacterium]
MTAGAAITLLILLLVLGLLVCTRRAPDAILWSGLGLLVVVPVRDPVSGAWQVGILTVEQAFAGLANEGVITIALLFVVAAALRDTGGMQWLAGFALGRPSSLWAAQNRIIWPTALASGFINNTPLVAMLLPVVDQWSKRQGLSASKLLIPMSYASIFGGACTLIGTSTNLVVNGWLISETAHPGLGMFEIAWVGVPVAAVGCLYMLLTYRWLLPDRKPPLNLSDDARQYTVEMIVEPGSDLAGKTVEQAGLRSLPGLYLIEIDRDEEV